jgi:hypothetical protein
MFKKIDFVLLFLAIFSSLQAKDYEIDKNGNINVNIVDRKVMVNDKVVRTIPKDKPVNVTIGNTNASINKDRLKANVGRNIGAKIDDDKMSANIGGIGAKIDGDNISVDIGTLLNNAIKNRNDDKEKDDNFFDGDPFFSK